MPISNTPTYVTRTEYAFKNTVALTKAAANAATASYTVGDLIALVNAAIDSSYTVTVNSTNGVTSVQN